MRIINSTMKKLIDVLKSKNFIKSVLSGCVTAAADFAFLFIFHKLLGWEKLLSVNVAFALAILVNFSLQKFWTFSDKDLRVAHKQLAKFLAISAINFVINGALMYILVSLLGVWYIAAQILVMAGLAVMNFTLYRIFVFK